jgi:hypothetical protein
MTDSGTSRGREAVAPGIQWEPGEEDYPFPARPGESALDFVRRWLDSAGYARIEQDGVRFVHEVDVLNLVNNVTADIELLRARLGEFGDQIVAASEHAATVRRIETAITELDAALVTLKTPLGR